MEGKRVPLRLSVVSENLAEAQEKAHRLSELLEEASRLTKELTSMKITLEIKRQV